MIAEIKPPYVAIRWLFKVGHMDNEKRSPSKIQRINEKPLIYI
jgi:hypothetical protein